MKIESANIILTGASSGFGKRLLEKLAAYNGTRIIAVARNIDGIPDHNGQVLPYRCDVSDRAEMDKLFDTAYNHFGTIDIFIANAGFAYYEKIEKADWQRIENIFAVNVFSPLYALEKIIESKPTKPVSVVITASAAGLVGLPGFSLYSASKFALNGFADAFKFEADRNIKLTVVYPVAAHTDFFNRSAKDAPLPYPKQSVNRVVDAIIYGIKSGKRKVYPSRIFRFGWPFLRISPALVTAFLKGQQVNFKKWLKNKGIK